MSLQQYKFTAGEFEGQDIVSLSNRPNEDDGLSARALKERFDNIGKQMLALGKFNDLLDALSQGTAAGELGASSPDGLDADTVQAFLDWLYGQMLARYTKSETDALIGGETGDLVQSVTLDSASGDFTVTKKDGTASVLHTELEKVPASFAIVEDGGKYALKVTNVDGSTSEADVTELMNVYQFAPSSTVGFETAGEGNVKTVTAAVRDHSVTLDKLAVDAVSELEGCRDAAAQSASTAAGSKQAAQSYAVGGTGTREGENVDNAKYYSQQAASSSSEAEDGAREAQSYAVGGTGLREEEATDNARYYKEQSGQNAAAASASQKQAENEARMACSYAVGGTGLRDNEDTDNAKWYKEQAEAAVGKHVLTAGKTVYVSPEGDDATGDGTQANPWKTIQKAVDEAPEVCGKHLYTIRVPAGTYWMVAIAGKSVRMTITGGQANVKQISVTDGGRLRVQANLTSSLKVTAGITLYRGAEMAMEGNLFITDNSLQLGENSRFECSKTVDITDTYYGIEANSGSTVSIRTITGTGNYGFIKADGGTVQYGRCTAENAAEADPELDAPFLCSNGGVITSNFRSDELAGKSLAGQNVLTAAGTTVTAGEGAEIFNDYRERTYTGETVSTGNVASGNYAHAEGSGTTATGNFAHAEGGKTVASGQCSHAECMISKATGKSSHAEGYGTEASGQTSHAEGYETIASGSTSHAEGLETMARGSVSHAEGGKTQATTDYTHAEGHYTQATGLISHAEGDYTQATGTGSHAEGNAAIAEGDYSHAEGTGTKAVGNSQHVQGEYNILDTAEDFERGAYAHIVGNGTSDTARSNAHTLDWSGNAWFAGDVYTGGTGQTDEAASKLATTAYADAAADKHVLTASKTVYVSPEGNDATGDGTQANPWKTIQKAVDEAPEVCGKNVYTIRVNAGAYARVTVYGKNVELWVTGGQATVTSMKVSNGGRLRVQTTGSSSLKTNGSVDGFGVSLVNSSEITVNGNLILGSGGLRVSGHSRFSSDNTVDINYAYPGILCINGSMVSIAAITGTNNDGLINVDGGIVQYGTCTAEMAAEAESEPFVCVNGGVILNDLATKAYVDSLIGDIAALLDAINGEVA